MAQRQKRISLRHLREHLVCVLCGGYLIDATTIVECLHSFCKTCIVRYLDSSKFCPICDVQVHKTKPLVNIRMDHTLQDMVYKLVPGLFQEEMKRRREFYKENVEEEEDNSRPWPEYYIDDDGEVQRERVIFSSDEQISLSLQLSTDGKPPKSPDKRDSKSSPEITDCRYLLCPAALTVSHLKKFIRLKFNLCDRYQIDVYHTDEILQDHYSLMDIAYIYMWRRKGPLRLFYTVYTNPAKRLKRSECATITSDISNDTNIVEMTCSSKASDQKDHSEKQISSTVKDSAKIQDAQTRTETKQTEATVVVSTSLPIKSASNTEPTSSAIQITEANPSSTTHVSTTAEGTSRPVEIPKKIDTTSCTRINVPNPQRALLLGFKSKDKLEKNHTESSLSKPKNQILSLPVKRPDSTVTLANKPLECSSKPTTMQKSSKSTFTQHNGKLLFDNHADSTTPNISKNGTNGTAKSVNSSEKRSADKNFAGTDVSGPSDVKKPKNGNEPALKTGIYKNGKDNHVSKSFTQPFVPKPPVSHAGNVVASGDKSRKLLHIPERPLHPYAPMAHYQSMNGLFHYRSQIQDYGNDAPQDLSMKKKTNETTETSPKPLDVKKNKEKDKNGEVDKYAFTEDDAAPVTSRKLQHVKSEPVTLN